MAADAKGYRLLVKGVRLDDLLVHHGPTTIANIGLIASGERLIASLSALEIGSDPRNDDGVLAAIPKLDCDGEIRCVFVLHCSAPHCGVVKQKGWLPSDVLAIAEQKRYGGDEN
ncbi:hypothetical protein [Brevundimonas sp. Bb-A]|uniref:hypothetical protein n=1 Tax=Brevundimonas sp. Bb-A TaxID=2560058 RepID=UPI00128F3893|nr:hypothetical protein [Brevundimonas sp. Bb-A]